MAATYSFRLTEAMPASADLSAKQYYFVELSTGKLAVCNAAGDFALGVLQDTPDAADKYGEVTVFGGTQVVAGAAVDVGEYITTDANGKAIPVDPVGSGGDAGNAVLGIARSAATADGQRINAVINCINPASAANTYS